ncbi:FecR domain-containing protein [Bythopirellula polymerisocia]|uniref:FecR protein n=1 Tax=Bythopirellula polymerisocia TaxID=2528003 RepID=A0A5C6CGM9_9BACT|nr:FecR domain-containing protein [Bythopirellula polymerisocia]TWU22714.1 FecR protein [Bythopirellula polymerisocia]
MSSERETLLKLCDLVSSGQADEAQVADLEAWMLEDESARQVFLDWSALHVDLQNLVGAQSSRVVLEEEMNRSSHTVRSILSSKWFGALAAVFAIALLSINWYRNEATPPLAESESSSELELDGMAIVNRIENVSWAEKVKKYAVGDLLKSSNWIEIESGVAEIEFGQGAVVILEGPARFVAKSTSVGFLDYGKLASVVPPWADGFRIDTSSVEVVDRGTQFVLEVTRDQKVSVGVTKGEVEVRQQGSSRETTAEKAMHRILAGSSIQSLGSKIEDTLFNEQWNSLSQQLPYRPDHTEVEVIAKYRRDFKPGIANEPRSDGNWRYFANLWSPVKEVDDYKELLWDSRRTVYDPNGDRGWEAGPHLRASNFSYRGGHPGQGIQQTDADFDHYVIAAYQVPKAGRYLIKSGWLLRAESREDLVNQSVDLRVWVNKNPSVVEETCSNKGLLRFQGDLGELLEGDWIYVAVGPQSVSYNDRFEWDFAIVREIEGVTL